MAQTPAAASQHLQRPTIALDDATTLLHLSDLANTVDGVTGARPVSATKNFVLRADLTGLGLCYLKTARTPDGTSDQLCVEQRAWEATRPGSTRLLRLPDGRTATAVQSAGTPPTALSADLAAPLASGIRRVHQLPVERFADLDVQTTARTHEYLTRRLGPLDDARSRDMKRLCDDLMNGLPNQPLAPLVVTHGDTTMLNFVLSVREDGTTRASWIDLETAVLGPAEWDFGAIWLAATIEGLPDLANRFLTSLAKVDRHSYAWSMRQLIASKLAWASWRTVKGGATFREDLDMLEQIATDYLNAEGT